MSNARRVAVSWCSSKTWTYEHNITHGVFMLYSANVILDNQLTDTCLALLCGLLCHGFFKICPSIVNLVRPASKTAVILNGICSKLDFVYLLWLFLSIVLRMILFNLKETLNKLRKETLFRSERKRVKWAFGYCSIFLWGQENA